MRPVAVLMQSTHFQGPVIRSDDDGGVVAVRSEEVDFSHDDK